MQYATRKTVAGGETMQVLGKPVQGRTVLFSVTVLCLFAIAFLVFEVVRDLRHLNSANSDNVQWTLSQAEVEFLEFQRALEQAAATPGSDLDTVLVEFDIFYSRIATLERGVLYAALRDHEDFVAPLRDVRGFLDDTALVMDGPRPAFRAAIPAIVQTAAALRPRIRALATAGLAHFADQSDARRDSVSVTLLRLALMTATLVLALALLARHAQVVRRQTEFRGQQLAEAYARLNTILQTSLDGVIVSDTKGHILDFNAAAERIFGHKRDDVLGCNIGAVIVPDHLRGAHDAGMERMQTSGERRVVGHGRVQLEAKRADGAIFPVELALEMAEAGGEQVVVAFLRDISHRVAAETELVDARDKALAGEKAKAEFLAMMTHEIRTPLNGVLGNLSLLADTALSRQQDRYVHNMDVSGKLLMSHVDAVLDIARFESGAAALTAEPVHLGTLIQDIVDSQVSAAEAAGNVLEWAWSGDPVTWVRTDPSRLQQILVNLVGNAIKFTENGRIIVEAERVLPAPEGAVQVEIRIIDTGIGIPEQEQARIFDDFQTTNAGFGRAVGGTGLGLGIARRFVMAMGGDIGVESAPGDGSVFWVRLPFDETEAPAAAPAAPKAPPVADLRRLDVLVVEDNEINQILVREMLEQLGHRVTCGDNGAEGLQLAEARGYDVILMDVSMPVMDGLEATKRIRGGQGPCRDVPILAFSANVLPEAKDRFLSGGMTDFLGKPVRKDELRLILQRVTDAGAPSEPVVVLDETAAETRDLLGEETFRELRGRFAEEAEALFAWLDAAPDDLFEIAMRCHKVAGTAASFGYAPLRSALLAVERAAERQATDDIAPLIAAAQAVWQAEQAKR